MNDEVWKDIPDYEGYYQVSNLGRVKRLKTTFDMYHPIGGYRSCTRQEKILKNKINNHGKIMISLSKKGKIKESNVARLVLKSFIGQPNVDQECCHINDIQTDNRLENLYWGTREDNIRDKFRNGKVRKGSEVGTSKLKEKEVLQIKKLISSGEYTDKEISSMFNVTRSCISLIHRNKYWKHIIYKKGDDNESFTEGHQEKI